MKNINCEFCQHNYDSIINQNGCETCADYNNFKRIRNHDRNNNNAGYKSGYILVYLAQSGKITCIDGFGNKQEIEVTE